MATQLQLRRGTTSETGSFTGAVGEVTVDTTKDTLVVHDGATAGGHEMAKANGSNIEKLTKSGATKIATTSSGVDVTGTAKMDGLTVDGATNDDLFNLTGAGSAFELHATSGNGATPNTSVYRLALDFLSNTNGFIDFYRGGAGNDGYLAFGSSGTEAMRIDSSQNVSIPSGNLTASEEFRSEPVAFTANQNAPYMIAGTSGYTGATTNWNTYGFQHRIKTSSAGIPRVTIDNHVGEAFSVDNSSNVSIPNGGLSVGGSNTLSSRTFFQSAGSTHVIGARVGANGHFALGAINASGAVVGGVVVNASSTAYNTSSDYRLKEDWQPLSGATDRLKELKPVNFAWKADGSRVDGFLAHEAQEVVPESVTGSKDAMMTEEYEVSPATGDIYTPEVVAVEGVEAVEYVAPQDEVLDEDGNVVTEAVAEVMAVEAVEAVEAIAEVIHSADAEQPSELEDGQLWRETTAQVMGEREVPDYQGIDQSKLVPLLVATIQELEARITALEA